MSDRAARPVRGVVKQRLNRALRQTTGYELRRVPAVDGARRIERPPPARDPDELAGLIARPRSFTRLAVAPTFVLSTVRSGSTLLRLILDSHPDICAPHELHLRRIGIQMLGHGRYALEQLGLDDRELRNLLWDRVLHAELLRSGKSRFVNKTPTDALMWPDLLACWPDARFIFLHRHPAAIVDSWARARTALTRDEVAQDVLAYAVGMEQARAARAGLVVRYEDLTADPAAVTRRICEFLCVDWSAAMIDYGAVPHGGMRRGLGDWSDKMRSGIVHPVTTLPGADRIPVTLRPVARAWGYLPT
jgi:hypothetical protein